MKLFHLTPKRKLNSILKNGLLPSKPSLDNHLESFQDGGLIGDKVIYFWDPTISTDLDKMVKDFIYCKHFITPRNTLDLEDYSKLGTKLFGEAEDWVLLEADVNKDLLLDQDYTHVQTGGDGIDFSTHFMKQQYEHDDKALKIGCDILNSKNIKIINEISSRLYSDDTIGVTFKKPLF